MTETERLNAECDRLCKEHAAKHGVPGDKIDDGASCADLPCWGDCPWKEKMEG